jgi:hypothetical protein
MSIIGAFLFKIIYMLIYRTDSDRTPREDQRTKALYELLKFKISDDLNIIFNGINDHKGNLFVYWKIKPTVDQMTMIDECWEFLHDYITYHYYQGDLIEY